MAVQNAQRVSEAAGQSGGDGDAGRLVGQRGNDPAVKITEELQQVRPAREGDFGASRFNGDNAETGGAGKALGIDGFGETRRVQGRHCSIYAGIRTGKDSMPLTKLE